MWVNKILPKGKTKPALANLLNLLKISAKMKFAQISFLKKSVNKLKLFGYIVVCTSSFGEMNFAHNDNFTKIFNSQKNCQKYLDTINSI